MPYSLKKPRYLQERTSFRTGHTLSQERRWSLGTATLCAAGHNTPDVTQFLTSYFAYRQAAKAQDQGSLVRDDRLCVLTK